MTGLDFAWADGVEGAYSQGLAEELSESWQTTSGGAYH